MYHMDQSEFSKDGWLSDKIKERKRQYLKRQGRPFKVAIEGLGGGIGELEFFDDPEHDDAAEREDLFELMEAYQIQNVEDGTEFFN